MTDHERAHGEGEGCRISESEQEFIYFMIDELSAGRTVECETTMGPATIHQVTISQPAKAEKAQAAPVEGKPKP